MAGPQFTIVAPCKGRRRHLEQALPTFRAQASCTVVVVDYDCPPDATAEWIGTTCPDVQVARWARRPCSTLTRSRNPGAAVATTSWLTFCDADHRPDPACTQRIASVTLPGTFLRPVFQGDQGCRAARSRSWARPPRSPHSGDTTRRSKAGDRKTSRSAGLRAARSDSPLLSDGARHRRRARGQRAIRFYTRDPQLRRLVGHYYLRVKQRYYATRGLDFTDVQRDGTYRRIREVVTTATSAEGSSEAPYAIDIPAADPPWTARLRAAGIVPSRLPLAPTR